MRPNLTFLVTLVGFIFQFSLGMVKADEVEFTNSSKPIHFNTKTKPFYVNGVNLPKINFDIGESYAGLLPISSHGNETRKLFFWYFPTKNPLAKDEITIWLNGGPGCSSLEAALQENGPFSWQPGTLAAVPNPWAWQNLTNMVYIDQPVGTGFSQGKPEARNSSQSAIEFNGFWKQFVDTFGLDNRKVFLTGESYAGQYLVRIADAMLNARDTRYFNVNSMLVYSPVVQVGQVLQTIPAVRFLNRWQNVLNLNQSTVDSIMALDQKCRLSKFLDDHLDFPPRSTPLPRYPSFHPDCDPWTAIYNAALDLNPCFNQYNILSYCPLLWDTMGFPGSFNYLPPGGFLYFNRRDVKKAIHAPLDVDYNECTNQPVFTGEGGDDQEYVEENMVASSTALASVIDRLNKTVLAVGATDFHVIKEGLLLTIQNMTFGGRQGFSKPPLDTFYVPFHVEYQSATMSGAGSMGKTITERKLTFVDVSRSGHMVPQFAPSAAYRHLEFLLGRVPNITTTQPFTFFDNGLKAQRDAGWPNY